MVDHVVSMAMKNKLEPEDLQKKAERMERMGDEKAAIYFDAAMKYKKVNVFSSDRRGARMEDAGDDEQHLYRLFDTKDKMWMGKATPHVKRLRTRADKKDLEYGAVRYVVRHVKA
jgi:hypothetical protein